MRKTVRRGITKFKTSSGQSAQLVRVNGVPGIHEADFSRILPSTIKTLVELGYFEPHEESYRITKLGMLKLKELEGLL